MRKVKLFIATIVLFPTWTFLNAFSKHNAIPPRFQWDENSGYCGEVSLISAGLYYGQYISQYDARKIANERDSQRIQLLLGLNDGYAAEKMHLKAIEWSCADEQTTDQFLAWVKQNVVKGYPVAIGVYTNEYLFYGNKKPNAGDEEYDHIVTVTGIASNHPLNNPNYYGNDVITFSDNGLWTSSSGVQYFFSYGMDDFQADRKEANAVGGAIYSLSNSGSNYGIAIAGVIDLNGDTLPVRVETNFNYEWPEIKDHSNKRPAAMPLELTINVFGLEPNVVYNLYRYSDLESVPTSHFNAHASQAFERWQFQISSGSNYAMVQQINTDEMAIYRCVRESAP